MVAGIGSFKAAFAEKVKKTEKENVSKPPDKRVKSRAASKCSGEVEAIWGSFWGELPSKLRFSVAIPECTSAAPQFLGVQAGAVACGAEPDGLASWRLVLEGTRTVVAAPVAAMAAIFGHQDPSKYWKLLLDIDQVNLDKIVGCGGLHSVTYGQNEMCYLPCGWIFCEKIMSDKDMIGFVHRGLTLRDHEAYTELQRLRKLLASCKKDDAHLLKSITAISTEEARLKEIQLKSQKDAVAQRNAPEEPNAGGGGGVLPPPLAGKGKGGKSPEQ